MNRQQKIALLESIESGSLKIKDLAPKKMLTRIDNTGNEYFINDKKVDKESYHTELKNQLVLLGKIPVHVGYTTNNDDGSYTPYKLPEKYKTGIYPEVILFS